MVADIFALATSTLSALTSLSYDVGIIGIVCGILLFLSFWQGKEAVIALIVSVIIALFLYEIFPTREAFEIRFAGWVGVPLASLCILFVLIGGVFVIVHSFIEVNFAISRIRVFLSSFFLSGIGGGVIIAAAYHTASLTAIYTFGPPFHFLFAAPHALFSWLLAFLITAWIVSIFE